MDINPLFGSKCDAKELPYPEISEGWLACPPERKMSCTIFRKNKTK